jgi:hypothetical protein
MQTKTIVALVAALMLVACGGGAGGAGSPGGGTSPWVPSGGTPSGNVTQDDAVAVTTVNSVGSTVDTYSTTEVAIQGELQSNAMMRRDTPLPSGQCTQTANGGSVQFITVSSTSTDTKYFYDAACTKIARDLMRTFTSGKGGGEEVNGVEQQYANVPSGATPPVVATRNYTTDYTTSGGFNPSGYPSLSAGYYLTSSAVLNVGNYRTIISNRELAMGAGIGPVNNFCSDEAGYNNKAITGNQVFAWEGGIANGTRTTNNNASNVVTWTSTRVGEGYQGPTGSFSINSGAPNSACPFTTPQFTLGLGAGTALIGTHNIPMQGVYYHGLLQQLTIPDATILTSEILNVSTNTSLPASSQQFITGTICKPTCALNTIATFGVDAFGDGTLTVNSSGNAYAITDWHARESL